MNNTQLLQAMALDLKRVAIGYHNGSIKMADRFLEEVFKRKLLLDSSSLQPSTQKLLTNLHSLSKSTNYEKRANDALMYSTLFLQHATNS